MLFRKLGWASADSWASAWTERFWAARSVVEQFEAYAHPDAMYRVFEHGLVLANPSLAPYKFDVSDLSPSRQYRRLQATDRQDTTVNDGTPVSGAVQLGERDALFLLRVEGTK